MKGYCMHRKSMLVSLYCRLYRSSRWSRSYRLYKNTGNWRVFWSSVWLYMLIDLFSVQLSVFIHSCVVWCRSSKPCKVHRIRLVSLEVMKYDIFLSSYDHLILLTVNECFFSLMIQTKGWNIFPTSARCNLLDFHCRAGYYTTIHKKMKQN